MSIIATPLKENDNILKCYSGIKVLIVSRLFNIALPEWHIFSGFYDLIAPYLPEKRKPTKFFKSSFFDEIAFNPLRLILIIFTHTLFTKSHYSGFCTCICLMSLIS